MKNLGGGGTKRILHSTSHSKIIIRYFYLLISLKTLIFIVLNWPFFHSILRSSYPTALLYSFFIMQKF